MILLRTKRQDQNLIMGVLVKMEKHTVCFRLPLSIRVPIWPHVLSAPRILKWDRGKGCKGYPQEPIHPSHLAWQVMAPSSTTSPVPAEYVTASEILGPGSNQ